MDEHQLHKTVVRLTGSGDHDELRQRAVFNCGSLPYLGAECGRDEREHERCTSGTRHGCRFLGIRIDYDPPTRLREKQL
jgi:hypothetical protein